MTIVTNRIDDIGAYADAVFGLLRREEKSIPRVYSDSRGIPTLGVGYALLVLNNQTGLWERKQSLTSDLAAAGITFVPGSADDQLLSILMNNLNAGSLPSVNQGLVPTATWDANDEEPLSSATINNKFSFPLLSPTSVRQLFDISIASARQAMRAQFTKHLTKLAASDPSIGNPAIAADNLFVALDQSQEMMALSSMAFNGPGLVGPLLTRSLYYGDRAEAWYEIRYNTDTQYARRFLEADTFGIYNEPSARSEQDFIGAYRMLTRHRGMLLGADNVGDTADDFDQVHQSALTDAVNLGAPLAITVQSLSDSMVLAYTYLVDKYITQKGLSTNVALYDIYVGEDDGSTAGDFDTRYYRGTDVDFLIGSTDNDLIFGESGNDTLFGRLGDDVLYGGSGVDTYLYRPGDGNDIIVDSDGKGRLVIANPATGDEEVVLWGGTRTGGSGSYLSSDNRYTFTPNGTDLVVTSTDFAGQITIKDFDPAAKTLNINLFDLNVADTTLIRIKGSDPFYTVPFTPYFYTLNPGFRLSPE